MKFEGDDPRMKVIPFNEEDYINRLLPQMMPKYQKETKMTQSKQIQRVYMVRRFKDNRIQEMSSKQYTEMKNNGSFSKQFELIGDVKTGSGLPEAPVIESPIETADMQALAQEIMGDQDAGKVDKPLGKLDCACGFKAKTKAGLTKHQKKHE